MVIVGCVFDCCLVGVNMLVEGLALAGTKKREAGVSATDISSDKVSDFRHGSVQKGMKLVGRSSGLPCERAEAGASAGR